MDCPNGHGPMVQVGRFWLCGECGHQMPAESPDGAPSGAALARGGGLSPLPPALPSTLVLVLDEYVRETDDYLALHRVCSALEIVARFLTVVALTDVWQRRVSREDSFPEALVKQLLQHLERPTLGSWRVLLEAAVAALPDESAVPGLAEYVRQFAEALGGANADPLRKLLPMRNVLAHGGRLSDEKVQELLTAHTERFQELMAGLEFLSEAAGVALVASPAEGPARLLRGLPPEYCEFDRSTLPEDFRQAGPDRMLLVTPRGVLDLCPLHAYGEVMQVEKDQLVEQGEEAIQLYARSDAAAGVDYTALGSRASSSRGKPDWETRFAEVFRLEAWRSRVEVESALARYTFSRRMDDLLRLFVGRDEQVAAAAALIDATESGVLWLAGKPGMGKSAFMAKLVRDVFQPRGDIVCIPYFFQAAEGDLCRVSAFAEAALLRLAQATGQDVKIEDDPEKRLDQLRESLAAAADGTRRMVFFLDGLDEISDPNLLDLIFGCAHPGVVWVCAGRDEPHLVERFSCDRCQWLFENEGLPPLKADNVRAFFIEELGHRLPQFFGRDKQQGGAWCNEYVEEVIRRSDGLPLYLKLLVQDIRKDPNAFAPGSEERLPRGLEEYYDRIVEEMGDDLSATIPAITTLLALAHEPLPFETLAALLSDHELVGQADGRELLQDALRHSSVMLRRAPTSTEALGYTLYHASFQQHVQTSDRVRRSRTAAQERLRKLATDWRDHEPGSPSRDYALRFGPRTLIDAGRWDDLTALLTDLEFIEATCDAGMTYELVTDYNVAPPECREAIAPFHRFTRANAHIFAQDLEWVVQRAYNSAASGPVAEAAERLLNDPARPKRPWLRHLHRPPDAPSACLQVLQGHTDIVRSVALTPDGRQAVTGSSDRTVRVWDLASGECLRTLEGHTAGVSSVALTPDGRQAVTGSGDRTVRVWDLNSGACLRTLEGHTESVGAVAITHDGQRVVTGSYDHTVRVWDLQSGDCLRILEGPAAGASAVALTPDGQQAVTGGGGRTDVRVWDLSSGTCVRTLKGHDVHAVAVTPDGRHALSASWDRTVRVWDLASGGCTATLKGHSGGVASVAVTPDGRQAVTGSDDKTARVWSLDNGARVRALEGHTSSVTSVALTPDGRQAATGSWDQTVRVWDLARGACVDVLDLSACTESLDWAVVVTADGRPPVTGRDDQTLVWWNLSGGASGWAQDCHNRSSRTVAVTPDGRRLLQGQWGRPVQLWDFESPAGPLLTFEGHTGWVEAVAVTPNGRHAVTGSIDRTARVWDLNSGDCLRTLQGHTRKVTAVALTPDGQRAVTGSSDNTVRVWDLNSGAEVARFAAEGDVGACVAGPGGLIVAGDEGGNVHFLRLENVKFGPPILTAWTSPEDGSLAFGCPHCRAWPEVPETALGTELPCPACGEMVTLNPFVIDADWRPVAEAWKGEHG